MTTVEKIRELERRSKMVEKMIRKTTGKNREGWKVHLLEKKVTLEKLYKKI